MASQGAKLLKTLTLTQVIVMGLAYLTPMAVFDTFAIVGDITDGRVATAYLLALGGILLTAFSYGHLVRKFPSAGSAYTYAQKVFNPYVGFMVGWSSLLDYMFMPMINILLAKIYLTAMFPGVDPWVFIFGLVTVMTFLNLRGINLVANLNGLIVVIQIAIITIFIGLMAWGIYHGEGSGTLMSSRSVPLRIGPDGAALYRCDHPVLLVSRLRRSELPLRRDPQRRQGDPQGDRADGADRRHHLRGGLLLPAALLPGSGPLQGARCGTAGDRPLCRRHPLPVGGAGLHHGRCAGLRHGSPRWRIAHPLRDGP